MTVRPLTSAQQALIDALLAAGRVAVVPVDTDKAGAFLRQADDTLVDIPHLTRPQNRYNLAYDACHDVGEALLAAYGYRTVNGPGQHAALGEFMRAVFDQPPGQQAAKRFGQLRRSRNQQRYDAKPVGAADADLAAQAAEALRKAATDQGIEAR
jgi:hypothetical protein